MHKLKAQISPKNYVEQQIQKCLNDAVVYGMQIRLLTLTLDDDSKKENAVKAITALNQQIEAGKEALKKWEQLYEELEKEEKK